MKEIPPILKLFHYFFFFLLLFLLLLLLLFFFIFYFFFFFVGRSDVPEQSGDEDRHGRNELADAVRGGDVRLLDIAAPHVRPRNDFPRGLCRQ